MPYISYLFSLLTAIFIVGALSGIAAFIIARNRRILAQAQAPTPVGADVWNTPVRAFTVFTAVAFAAIVMPILTPPSAIGFFDVAIAVLLLAAIAWATPAGIIAPTEASAALIGAGPVFIAAATAIAIYAVKGEATYYDSGWHSRAPLVGLGLGLAVAGVVRARFGIPEAQWYATHAPPAAGQGQGNGQQQAQSSATAFAQPTAPTRSTAPKKHMVLPNPISHLAHTLKNRVHGQLPAISRFITQVMNHSSFFSVASTKPLVIVVAGPDSCGKRHFAHEFARAVQGDFRVINHRSDVAGEELYVALKAFRVNGEANVIYLEGLETSKKASDVITQVVLEGHPFGDNWSRAVIVIPIVTDDKLPPNGPDLVNALSTRVSRTLLNVAIVVPMQALDEDAKVLVGDQVASDLGKTRGLDVVGCTTDAMVAMIATCDPQLPGALAVQAAVQASLGRRIEKAAHEKWGKVRIGHDGANVVVERVTESAKA